MSNQTPKERLTALLSDDAYDLFPDQGSIEEGIEEACRDFLLSRDYKVVSPPSNNLNVKNALQLRDRFYALVNRKYAGHYANLGRGKTFDNKIMRNFIDSRMKDGVTRKVALLECARIMETVILKAEKMGIEGQITINMFDPGAFSWIVEKAVKVINNKIKLDEDVYADALCDQVCELGREGKSWAMFDINEEVTDGEEESSS